MSSLSQHTLRQLKFVVPGAAATAYLRTAAHLRALLRDPRPWPRPAAQGALALAALTLAIFLAFLVVPRFTGRAPDYRAWRASAVLQVVIPVLTASIVSGWILLVVALGQWSALGYLQGAVAAVAAYALAFGLLGLVPAPRARPQ